MRPIDVIAIAACGLLFFVAMWATAVLTMEIAYP